MRGLALILCLIVFGVQTTQAQTKIQQRIMEQHLGAPLFEPALDYAEIPEIEACEERTLRAPKYHFCRDSSAIYAKALSNAQKKNQPLMVVFGFDSCPACADLRRTVFNPKRPMTNDHLVRYLSRTAINQYVEIGEPITISVVYINGRSDHGLDLADKIGATKIAKARGANEIWSPFILFVNPYTDQKHSDSYWDAETAFCDWGAEFAAGIEAIGYAPKGNPYIKRKLCKT